MFNLSTFTACLALSCAVTCASAQTNYTAAGAGPITVRDIWTGEGSSSPFVNFVEQFDAGCYDGRGAYLFNIVTPGTAQARNFQMTVALLAKTSGKRVSINYMRGGSPANWGACYITGITLLD